MEVPTPHILINILLGLTSIAGVITALAFAFDKYTRNFGICLGAVFIAVSIAQTITSGYSDFGNVPYWWLLLVIAAVSAILSVWKYARMPHSGLLGKEFWRRWKRAFWMLFGVMIIVGILKSVF